MTKADELWVCGSSALRASKPREGAAELRVEAVRPPPGQKDAREAISEWAVLPPPDQIVMKLNLQGQVLLAVPLVKTPVAQPPSAVEGGGSPPGGGGATGKPGELDWVHGIAVDSQGSLYLGDIQGHGRRSSHGRRDPYSLLEKPARPSDNIPMAGDG